jgi:predicted transglutaminase-like cysteine proteinase
MITRKFAAAAFTAFFCLTTSAAYAIGPGGMAAPSKLRPLNIVAAKATLAPFAFVKFCVANAADCANPHGDQTVPLTSTLLRQLRQVNTQVNRSIDPRYDNKGDDEWQADVSSGDCEDYALTKRRRLIELGWSPNALRMAIAYTPDNSGHAVLVVSTTKGDFVLDNRINSVRNWRDTDLRWVMIQSPNNPLSWNQI